MKNTFSQRIAEAAQPGWAVAGLVASAITVAVLLYVAWRYYQKGKSLEASYMALYSLLISYGVAATPRWGLAMPVAMWFTVALISGGIKLMEAIEF
ncbi:hypothetical protein ACVOZ6_004712 [Escherichia coli]